YQRTKGLPQPQPTVVYTLARESHDSEPVPAAGLGIQHSYSYSDGFGREIQKKIQAEPGPIPQRDAAAATLVGPDAQPAMTLDNVTPRWVGSGWTVFNNKAKPIRRYEPFFTDTHAFEFDARIGVSPTLFYDPLERAVVTLHPNHTWEKTVWDPWRQKPGNVGATVTLRPEEDEVRAFFIRADGPPRLPKTEYLPTGYAVRTNPVKAAEANRGGPDPDLRA